MTYHGLFIGIDYRGTSSQLGGCIADSKSWRGRESGVDVPRSPGEVCATALVLTEQQATKRRVVECLRAIAEKCPLGGDDYFVIQFSGHGTYRRGNDPNEVDGNDEAICCYDFLQGGLLWDNEINVILSGGQGLLVTDCCHSHTLLRSAFEIRPRFIPFDQITEGMSQCEINKICEAANQNRARASSLRDANGAIQGIVHLAGCKDNEYSYDANFGGQPNGAMTYFALESYRQLPVGANFQQWIDLIQSKLPDRANRYPQHPQMTATAADMRRVLPGRDLPTSQPVVQPPAAAGPGVEVVVGGYRATRWERV